MDKFSYFRSYYEALKGMKAKSRYAIREAIDEYMFEGKEPTFSDSLSKAIWSLLLPTLDKSKTYFANGKLKGKSEANQKQIENQSKANEKQNGSKDEANASYRIRNKEKDKEEEKKEEKKTPGGVRSASASPVSKFIKPTEEQVQALITKRGYHFTAEEYMDHYNSNGWKVGNAPMKDWQAACGTFERNWKKWNPVVETEPEVKQKPVPYVSECPKCHSNNIVRTLDRVVCKSCGAFHDYNHSTGGWERV